MRNIENNINRKIKKKYHQLFEWLEYNAKIKCTCKEIRGHNSPCANHLKLAWTNWLINDTIKETIESLKTKEKKIYIKQKAKNKKELKEIKFMFDEFSKIQKKGFEEVKKMVANEKKKKHKKKKGWIW